MTAAHVEVLDRAEGACRSWEVTLLCWQCGAPLAELTPDTRTGSGIRTCQRCKMTTQYKNGIWRALSPDRVDHFRKFIAEYELIRAAEGRGSAQPGYYLSLPFKDISGRNSDQWAIRARTFRTMQRSIVAPLARRTGCALRILDLGAGNGWLSYRLALQGHLPIAVDLLTNDRDGLGAAVHYNSQIHPLFPRVQAELDRLPFVSSVFDLVIFNASFHYSVNYERTLAEAVRCTCPGGSVVIADTPWYAEEESGRRMVEEKRKRFFATYGFASDSVASLEYLTPARLQRLGHAFNLGWRYISPFYGIRWALRPLRAKLAGNRPPSQFRIYEARVGA
jgi:SAM-dependent methyltransferase